MPEPKTALQHWAPWMIIAYIFLVFVIVGLYNVNHRTVQRDAEIQAMTAGCLVRMYTVLGQNTKELLAASPADDPLRPVRIANARRIDQARKNLAGLTVPTVSECRALKR